MSAIEQMLAEDAKRRRSAIAKLQAKEWEMRVGDSWRWQEDLLRDAILELWATVTLMVEIQKMRRRPWWRRLLRLP